MSREGVGHLPPAFLVIAVGFYVAGVVAAPWVVRDLVEFFYQPRVLALVHAFTLGWITTTMMGVMHRFVPALTKRPLPFPRLVVPQLAIHAAGVAGLLGGFLSGRWTPAAIAGAALAVSSLLFAANLAPCLAPAWRRGAAELGMFLGVGALVATALLGFTLAADKSLDFLRGSMLGNLAAHAHLAAAGWVSLVICAVSYRMLPAFLLPTWIPARAALAQIAALATSVVLLVLSLLGALPGWRLWAVTTAAALAAWLPLAGAILWTRRMPVDWTTWHVVAAGACLGGVLAAGVALAFVDPGSALGSRLAAVYGVLALLGWATNFIVGVSYPIFPGLVAGARAARGFRAASVADLSRPGVRRFVFVALNGGLVILATALVRGEAAAAAAGSVVYAAGGLAYGGSSLATLSFAWRRGLPKAARDPLRVLP